MATIKYTGTFNGLTAGADGQSILVEGQALPRDAYILSMTYSLNISAGVYSSVETWNLHWFAVGKKDGSPSAWATSDKMDSGAHTFTGKMNYSQDDVEQFTSGSFYLYAKANTTHKTTSYMNSFSITIEYMEYTRCSPPEEVTIEKTITAAEKNMLSWSGASGGKNNEIAGYYIQFADSADGEKFGEYEELEQVETSEDSYELEVRMPKANMYRKFIVWTLGSAGSLWRSEEGTESDVTYRGHAELEGFTDAPLVAGETLVKALHMQELQERANLLREFYGLTAYSFTVIKGGETDLKNWTAHVNEIRSAVDEISTDHDAWIAFSVNCPSADVIEQLRSVILAM